MNTYVKAMWVLIVVFSFSFTTSQIKGQPLPTNTISAISWQSNQQKIAVGRINGSVEIWNANSGQLLLTLTGHSQSISGVAWSPDGNKLATSSSDQTVRIWNTTTGQLLFTLAHSDVVTDVAWSSDGSRIFSNLELPPNNLYVWNATTGQLISQASGGGSRILPNSDGSKLLYLRSSNNVEIWNASTVTQISGYSQPNTVGGDTSTGTWNPNSNQFATGTLNGLVKIWDASTGVITNSLQANTASNTGPISQRVIDVRYSLDGSRLSSVSNDGAIRVWNTSTWALITSSQLPGTIYTAAFSPDATKLAFGGMDGTLQIVEVSVTATRPVETITYEGGIIWSVAWSPDGSKLGIAHGSMVDLVDASNYLVLKTLKSDVGGIFSIDWNAAGTKLVTASADYGSGVRVWDVKTGKVIATEGSAAIWVKWNPDDVRIAVCDIGGGIGIWNTVNDQTDIPLLIGNAVDWSPDGSKLISGVYDANPLTITNIATREQMLVLPGHDIGVEDVDWSPDGAKIASVGDNTVRVWNPTDGSLLLELTGHRDIVAAVAWNSNNRLLASGGADTTVRLWDTQTGQLVAIFQSGSTVRTVAWSPDGSRLAFGGDDGTLQIVSVAGFLTPTPTPTD